MPSTHSQCSREKEDNNNYLELNYSTYTKIICNIRPRAKEVYQSTDNTEIGIERGNF